jgi:KDO2-lipid IV(A) lauroyltransferase
MNFTKIANYMGFAAFWLTVQLCRLLPFKILYALSDGLYLIIYYLIPFRRKIALENLSNAFPKLSNAEINSIHKQHVHFMCDMMLETLKGFTLNETEIIKRWKVTNPEFIAPYRDQSIIIISSHYGNWEWGISLKQQINYPCINVYKPIRNSLINNYILNARKKIGVTLIAVKETARYFLAHRNKPGGYALIADQHPGGAHEPKWLTFLNQETAFIVGPEKYAKNFNYPVIYVEINYLKRGYYQATLHAITDHPTETPDGEITEKSMRILEQQICAKPAYWLWGHKRWKLKRTL